MSLSPAGRPAESPGHAGPVHESVRRLPSAALRPFIGWYSGYRDAGQEPATHRGLPGPYLTLIITFDVPLTLASQDPAAGLASYLSLVGGLDTEVALITHQGWQAGIQIALSPLGARALLGVPAGELARQVLEADQLGSWVRELREQVQEAANWEQRFAAVDGALLNQLRPDRAPSGPVSAAWQQLLASGGATPVPVLADRAGWSSRHFADRFTTEIGLSPKVAARVIRFDRAHRLVQARVAAGRPVRLADVAADTGFYDQAHLAREFGALAGCSPSTWLAQEFRNIQAMWSGTGTD